MSLLLSLNMSFHYSTLDQNSVKRLLHLKVQSPYQLTIGIICHFHSKSGTYQTGPAFSTLHTLIHHRLRFCKASALCNSSGNITFANPKKNRTENLLITRNEIVSSLSIIKSPVTQILKCRVNENHKKLNNSCKHNIEIW